MPDVVLLIFFFVLGACVGSFLNVVAGRFPQAPVERRFAWLRAISYPPSHCPRCGHFLAWRDNLPVVGWILLGGKCRYCRQPISIHYPIVEAVTGLLFAGLYAMFFIVRAGPSAPAPIDPLTDRMPVELARDWPMFALYLFLAGGLVVITLIDAERFEIPLALPWLMALVGVVVHALVDTPTTPGALNVVEKGRLTTGAALAAGGAAGLLVSLLLSWGGMIRDSFPDGEPFLEIDKELWEAEAAEARQAGRKPPPMPRIWTRREIRREIRKEMAFLMPPLAGALLWHLATERIDLVHRAWHSLAQQHWLTGALGAVLGALAGGLVVWLARILGTIAFGRVAMGLGDVHLMFGGGAIIGAGASTLAFFLAPFAGLAYGIWRWLTRGNRELPYGPFLGAAAMVAVFVYAPVARYLAPGFAGLREMLLGP